MAGVSLLSFAFLQLAPGNFFSEMRLNPQVSEETVQNLRRQFALDQPLTTRYWRWLRSVIRGEFGFSFAYNSEVGPLLMSRVENTLLLTSVSTLLAWFVAIPLGVWSAAAPQSVLARMCSVGNAVLLATPELLLTLIALLFAVRSGWIRNIRMGAPLGGASHGWQVFATTASHLVLPAVVLALTGVPVLLQHTASTVQEALGSSYISAARAHGIGARRILFHHALRASLNPLTTFLGTSIASLLSISLVVEIAVGWPGIGPLLLEAIMNRDVYVVIAGVMLSAVFLVGGMFAADMLLFAVDPRIRTERLA
jgi:peptide/nickel transport system permease protein